MNLRDYLNSKGVWVDALCWPSYGQSAGGFSDLEDGGPWPKPINLYIQEQYGRFGNNVYQLLHALIVARNLSIKNIFCNFYLDEAKTRSIIFDDMVVRLGVGQPPKAPCISATMFYPQGFEAFLRTLDFDLVKCDAERLSRTLLASKSARHADRNNKNVVFHFRSGDIFEPNAVVNSIYTQPPLSYYTKSLEHVCATIDVFDIHIVSEDDRNPCIGRFRDVLAQRGITYREQSSSLLEDAGLIASADCVVSSFGSFCEVLALMNENISRWYSFRSIAAYDDIDPSISRNFADILRNDGTDIFLVSDNENLYTPRGGWRFTLEQVEMLLNYPISNLSIEAVGNPD